MAVKPRTPIQDTLQAALRWAGEQIGRIQQQGGNVPVGPEQSIDFAVADPYTNDQLAEEINSPFASPQAAFASLQNQAIPVPVIQNPAVALAPGVILPASQGGGVGVAEFGPPDPTALGIMSNSDISPLLRSAPQGQQTGPSKFELIDDRGSHVFKTQKMMDDYSARRSKDAKRQADVQSNVTNMAMMGALQRKARLGVINPAVAAIASSRIASNLIGDMGGNLLTEDGYPTAELAAKNPVAAQIVAEAQRMRNELGLGSQALDTETGIANIQAGTQNRATDASERTANRGYDTQQAIAEGQQAVQREGIQSGERIVGKQEEGATARTKLGADATVKATDIQTRGSKDVANIVTTGQVKQEGIRQGGETGRAKIAAKSAMDVMKEQGRTQKYVTDKTTGAQIALGKIDAAARKYGINAEQAVAMAELDIKGKMTDAQIENLSAMTGIEKDRLANDHTARMAALATTQDEITKRYNTQMALGTREADARDFALNTTRAQVGAEFVDRAAGRAFDKQKFQFGKYLGKREADRLDATAESEKEILKMQASIATERMAAEKELAKINQQIAMLDSVNRQRELGIKEQEMKYNADVAKVRVESELARMKNETALNEVNLDKARIENEHYRTQAEGDRAVMESFPISQYPDVADRVSAKATFIAKNRDKITAEISDGRIPPIVKSYLNDMKANAKGVLWHDEWLSDEDSVFRNFAISELGSILGDDRLAIKAIPVVNGEPADDTAKAMHLRARGLRQQP